MVIRNVNTEKMHFCKISDLGLMKGNNMNKRNSIYLELKMIAEKSSIDFDSQFLHLGRGLDCGELCIEYDNEEGYILFAYDRDLKTYYYSTKDIEKFKYVVFSQLCEHNGFKYELSYRRKNGSILYDDNNLDSDTRKIAFEYALYQLNKINPEWMKITIPKYEELLNKWRDNKNVKFDSHKMKFNNL